MVFTFPKIVSVKKKKNDEKILYRMQFYIKVPLLKYAVNPFRLTGEGTLRTKNRALQVQKHLFV